MPSGKVAFWTQKSNPLTGSWWCSQGFYLSLSKIRYKSTETTESQFESQCIFLFLKLTGNNFLLYPFLDIWINCLIVKDTMHSHFRRVLCVSKWRRMFPPLQTENWEEKQMIWKSVTVTCSAWKQAVPGFLLRVLLYGLQNRVILWQQLSV